MKPEKRISRRQFLAASTAAAAGMALAACQPATGPAEPQVPATTVPEEATSAPEQRYKEAPDLQALEEAGDLPPVEERLPVDPWMLEPIDMIGVYGGTWKWFLDSVNRIVNVPQFADVGLLEWNRDQNATVPCMVESWEVKEDGTEFTIMLRKGLKWSDGAPFTADDIMFWWDDIAGNEEISPSKPGFMYTPGRQLGNVEKVDETTLTFAFPESYGMFVTFLTKQNMDPLAPKHYLSQFHPKYVDQADLDAAAEEGGFAGWAALFDSKRGAGNLGMSNPDLPTLYAWLPTVEPPSERFVFVRNPYFFAVDSEGHQLPYIDQVDVRIVTAEVINMKIVAGEPNFQASRQQAFKEMPLYMQYAEENEYEVYEWGDLQISEAGIWVNQNTPDPVDREIFQDKRFRIALSVAIDRERINQTLYSGMGKPTAATLPPVESLYYKDEYATAYTQYDPEMANGLLDEMGLEERDSDGFRLKPDGSRAAFVIEVPNARLGMIDNLNMIKDDYEAIGIELIVKPEDSSLYNQRQNAGEMQLVGWPMGKAGTDTGLVPNANGVRWAPLWGLWFSTAGEQGEEPPEHIKELQDAWSGILRTVDEEEKAALYEKILTAQAENVWVIGVVGPVPKPIIKKKWLHNVKKDGVWSYHHGHFIGCTDPFMFFIEKDKQ